MQLQFTQLVVLPRTLLFAFHENPAHLGLLHQGWSSFRLIHHDGKLTPGSKIWFEITVAGIVPVVLGFEHVLYEPPHRFGERLIHGPFRRFEHIHEFEEVAAGTLVRDHLEVEMPWCYGGKPVMRNLVAPLFKRAFQYRANALLQLAHSGIIVERVSATF